jgi:hypothetical protein
MTLIRFTSAINNSNMECNSKILQYYGLEGISAPLNEKIQDQAVVKRYCRDIQNSCCTNEDFIQTKTLWNHNIQRVKKYLTKTYRIIQKIILTGPSLKGLVKLVKEKDPDMCGTDIDVALFDFSIEPTKIYDFFKDSFETMAYLQKGFYCSICDQYYQKYFMVKKDYDSNNLVISHNTCKNIIHRFRNFLEFKTRELEPFVENAYKLFSCSDKTKTYSIDIESEVSYNEVYDCINNGVNCTSICTQFRVGGMSDLFMGMLDEYEEFYENYLEFLKKIGADKFGEEAGVIIPDYTLKTRDFFEVDRIDTEEFEKVLNGHRISEMGVMVADEGLDLFEIAKSSEYIIQDYETDFNKEKEHEKKFNANLQAHELELGIDPSSIIVENKNEVDFMKDHLSDIDGSVFADEPSNDPHNNEDISHDQINSDMHQMNPQDSINVSSTHTSIQSQHTIDISSSSLETDSLQTSNHEIDTNHPEVRTQPSILVNPDMMSYPEQSVKENISEVSHQLNSHKTNQISLDELHNIELENNTTPLENNTTPLENNITPLENNTTPLENNTTQLENNITPLENNYEIPSNELVDQNNTISPEIKNDYDYDLPNKDFEDQNNTDRQLHQKKLNIASGRFEENSQLIDNNQIPTEEQLNNLESVIDKKENDRMMYIRMNGRLPVDERLTFSELLKTHGRVLLK